MTRKTFKMSDHVKHPGVMLRTTYMPQLQLTHEQLRRMLGIPGKELTALLRGKAPITHDLAQELGRIFNTRPLFWISLQSIYDESQLSFRPDVPRLGSTSHLARDPGKPVPRKGDTRGD